jgi:beta-phosphoglucomutase-like phosphatase (HAD superfamily)
LASSANRQIIDKVLDLSGLRDLFRTTVSSEEVPRGKPKPDVYLEVAHRLGRRPQSCVAVEDSANGIRAAIAAGLQTVAVPNPHYPPPLDVLRQADFTINSLADLTVAMIDRLGRRENLLEEHLDEEEADSFPASDPHSDWAGPPS